MIGKTISHFRILEKLGEGGMGVVYKARDSKLDRDVALKFLSSNVINSREEGERFEREARAISGLNHPHIATIYDFEEVEVPDASGTSQRFLAMEFLGGGTLKTKLAGYTAGGTGMPLDDIIRYAVEMAGALAHAHRHQIVHRDVKAENFMLTDEGTVKLTDFGLAKVRGSAQVTQAGSTVGTAAYMSPEQMRGEEVDHRTDIFSFGVVLYELTTGAMPFTGEFEAAVGYSILNEKPAPVRSLRKDIPEALESVIDRCLEKEKDKRYQQADEIVSDLKAVGSPAAAAAATAGSSPRTGSRKTALVWAAATAAVLIVAGGIYFGIDGPVKNTEERMGVAVLPFVNLSDSREDEYFSDGVTEDIIAALSKLGGLKVISRTSVMQYKGTKKTMRVIGEELGVPAALEGSVRRSGDHVKVVAQLIDVSTDEPLWTETYDKELTEAIAIQGDIARNIAVALKGQLTDDERGRVESSATSNYEAYNLYLLGRFHWNRRKGEDMLKAIGYFEEAIGLDSGYALAYSGVADSYSLLPWYGAWSPAAAAPPARRAARKALELDPALGEAHASMAAVQWWFDWDWKGAEASLREAIRLSPNYATAYQWLGHYLAERGRVKEGRTLIQRAIELDPLSPIINVNYGDLMYYDRDYDGAIAQYRRSLEIAPGFTLANEEMGLAFLKKGMYAEAIAELRVAGTPEITAAYHALGRTAEADSVIAVIRDDVRRSGRNPMDLVAAYTGIGDLDAAFRYLDQAVAERRPDVAEQIIVDPYYDPLRADPRINKVFSELGAGQ